MFAVTLAVLMLLGVNVYIAAIGAAIIGFCVSYLFLGKQRRDLATTIDRYRNQKVRDDDNDVENEALDRVDPDLP
ncbi:MAG: hypothetical protein JWM49_2774 [Microbacteriaceae bacterium]|nr:hypothetical protein [Microbacteriaceae bacterium]